MSACWSYIDVICLPRRRRKMGIINFFPVLRCALSCPEPWICSWPRWWEIGNGSDLIFANFCLHEEASDLKRSHADIRWTQIASMSFHFPQFSLLNKDEIFPKYFFEKSFTIAGRGRVVSVLTIFLLLQRKINPQDKVRREKQNRPNIFQLDEMWTYKAYVKITMSSTKYEKG